MEYQNNFFQTSGDISNYSDSTDSISQTILKPSEKLKSYDRKKEHDISTRTIRDIKQPKLAHLGTSLLNHILEILESIDSVDPIESTNQLSALQGITSDLWIDAIDCSQPYQSVLALFESAILSVTSLNQNQIKVLSEAVSDLGRKFLTISDVEFSRNRFIESGLSPLAIMSEINNFDHNETND